MSAERYVYLDSSALVKLAAKEGESSVLRRYLSRRRRMISSALVRTELPRALLYEGPAGLDRAAAVLAEIDLVRVNDRVLRAAGTLLPVSIRSLDAIHLATAQQLGDKVGRIVTYDRRMAEAAEALGMAVATPR